jgi:hypothetical protein
MNHLDKIVLVVMFLGLSGASFAADSAVIPDPVMPDGSGVVPGVFNDPSMDYDGLWDNVGWDPRSKQAAEITNYVNIMLMRKTLAKMYFINQVLVCQLGLMFGMSLFCIWIIGRRARMP